MEYLPEQCAEVRSALPLYVGGDLDPSELEAVGGHLGGCPSCAALHERARAARGVLVEHLRTTASGTAPSLWEGVRAGLHGSLEEEGGRMGSATPALSTAGASGLPSRIGRPTPLRRVAVGGLAAAAAVVLTLGLTRLMTPAPLPALPAGGGSSVARTISASVPVADSEGGPTKNENDSAGGLRHVGSAGVPLYRHAVEVVPDQGLLLPPTGSDETDLVGGPRRLRVPGQR